MAFAERDMVRGLERDEFFPVFQPMIELRTGELAGFEVLARWQPPGSPVIMPDEFIPVMERSGLIQRLGPAILGKALAVQSLSENALMLSFNVSARQLIDPRLPEQIESIASASRVPLDRLTIEITESALLDDLPHAATVVHELKELHCRLALDDFGTGYSSLRHLHALPFDELKVDRSFVSSMHHKRESRKIVASVIGLGQGLGLMTVAEGVETREQAEMLFWLGCDLGQGWLFGRPVLASQLDPILNRDARETIVAPLSQHDGPPLLTPDPIPAHRVAQLQAIFDSAPVGLCFLDREMRYVNLNRRLAEMNGVPASAHIGRKVSEVIPHIFPIVEPFIRRALAGESLTGVEITRPVAREGGVPTNIVVSYHPVRDEAGDVLGVSVAIMDVTHSKLTEERLRESEEHFRQWIALAPNVPWILNEKGEVIEGSPHWTDYTGQPIPEALGNGWLKMLHPDDVPHTVEAIRRTLAEGVPINIKYRVRRPGEDWIWMHSHGAPRFDASGRVVCVYGVVEEFESKEVSDELQRCEHELRSAIEAIPIGIILADGRDAAIFMVNPCAHITFGNNVFPGQKLHEYGRMGLLDAQSHPLAAEEYPLARSIQRGEVIESRPLLFRRANGAVAHLSVSSRPIRSDKGKLIGAMMMVHDPEVSP